MSDIPMETRMVQPRATTVTDDQTTHLRNHAHWGAIIGGVVAALVIQLLLNILGVAIGLTTLDVSNMADNPSAQTASATTAGWVIISGILASLVGGVAAGRLCGSADRGTARWHGFLSWCATTIVLAYVLTTAVGGLIGGTFGALGNTLGTVGKGAASVVSGAATTASNNADPLAAQVRRLVNPNSAQSAQDAVVAYIRDQLDGNQQAADNDRSAAVNSLARAANISPDEANTRLQQASDQARQAADQAKQKAQAAAEAAQKGVATAGFFGFVALALGGFAAMIGGGLGAPHRFVDRRRV